MPAAARRARRLQACAPIPVTLRAESCHAARRFGSGRGPRCGRRQPRPQRLRSQRPCSVAYSILHAPRCLWHTPRRPRCLGSVLSCASGPCANRFESKNRCTGTWNLCAGSSRRKKPATHSAESQPIDTDSTVFFHTTTMLSVSSPCRKLVCWWNRRGGRRHAFLGSSLPARWQCLAVEAEL